MTEKKNRYLPLVLVISTFLIYNFSNPLAGNVYDYTFRIANALVEGHLGLKETPPSWLNEMIPLNGMFYSAFPLGSVLSVLPLAIFNRIGLLENFPGTIFAAIIAAITCLLLYKLSARYGDSIERRILLTLFPLFGTWMWANLAF